MVLELVGAVKVRDGRGALLQPRLGDVDVLAGLLTQRPDDVHVGVHDGVVGGPAGRQLLPEEDRRLAVPLPANGGRQVVLWSVN